MKRSQEITKNKDGRTLINGEEIQPAADIAVETVEAEKIAITGVGGGELAHTFIESATFVSAVDPDSAKFVVKNPPQFENGRGLIYLVSHSIDPEDYITFDGKKIKGIIFESFKGNILSASATDDNIYRTTIIDENNNVTFSEKNYTGFFNSVSQPSFEDMLKGTTAEFECVGTIDYDDIESFIAQLETYSFLILVGNSEIDYCDYEF